MSSASDSSSNIECDGRPLCGLVCADNDQQGAIIDASYCMLEFMYITPSDSICKGRSSDPSSPLAVDGYIFDFTTVFRRLARITARGRHAIVRLSEWPDYHNMKDPVIPTWLVNSRDTFAYVKATSDVTQHRYASWKCAEWPRFYSAFIRACGRALDADTRVAWLQGFVGHWAEGHVWRPDQVSVEADVNDGVFPTPEQYKQIVAVATEAFKQVRWSMGISVGTDVSWGGNGDNTKLPKFPSQMGTFEDTFMTVSSADYNHCLLKALGEDRWQHAPRGGEISFEEGCQERALTNVTKDTKAIADYHATYLLTMSMWGDCPKKDDNNRRAVSLSLGYRFEVGVKGGTTVSVKNIGVAPIYYPTHVSVGDWTDSTHDLQQLLPGASVTITPPNAVASAADVRLCCVRVSNQRIPFDVAK